MLRYPAASDPRYMVAIVMSYVRKAWTVFAFAMILAAFGIFALIVGMTIFKLLTVAVEWYLF
jgi:hypothetical protein